MCPPLGFRAEQGRLVLAAGVEQEARPGFNRRAQAVVPQEVPHAAELLDQVGVVGVEGVVVERQRDPLVPQVGEDGQRVLQPVMREPVGVVAEKHE